MKSGSQNLLIMCLLAMCCWQVKILCKNTYEEFQESKAKAQVAAILGVTNNISLEKPYILETELKKDKP